MKSFSSIRGFAGLLRLAILIRLTGAAFFIATAFSQQAHALTEKEAIDGCVKALWEKGIQACMAKGATREQCNITQKGTMKPCVMAALNKAHGRANVAIGVGDGGKKKETIKPATALPVGFVAPPRTISD